MSGSFSLCEWGNPEWKNTKSCIYEFIFVLNSATLDFLVMKMGLKKEKQSQYYKNLTLVRIYPIWFNLQFQLTQAVVPSKWSKTGLLTKHISSIASSRLLSVIMQMTSVPYGANNGIESHFWPHGFDKQMQCKNDSRFIFKDHNT